jgi:hypothetical protein
MDEGSVSGFLNLGTDPNQYQYPRGSRYFKLWCKVNGGLPKRGQPMNPEDFLGQFLRVKVEDARDINGNPLPEAEQYSKITEFLECIGP